jgi:hypothetical protein
VTTQTESEPILEPPHRTGDVRDFDFLQGSWAVHNRTLRTNADGGEEWIEYPSSNCMTVHLGGVMNIDEFQFPTKGFSAAAVRIFDLETRQWSIYWIESRAGVLLPPVKGGFDGGDTGEFYGLDEQDGKPALFRFEWTRLGRDQARWQQAFSHDGRAWKINWVMELSRTTEPS